MPPLCGGMWEVTVKQMKQARFKLLFLDDDQNRHEQFEKWTAPLTEDGHVVQHVYTVKELIEKVLGEQWDIIFLDHGLADETENGTVAAKWLANITLINNPTIVVHSWNPPAAREMSKILEESNFNHFDVLTLPFGPGLRTYLKGLEWVI